MTATILAQAKGLIAELRDQAKAAFANASKVEQQAAEPAARLTEMAERKAALLQQLDALDAEMGLVREEYEALRAEHVHHTTVATQTARAADYYEQTTLPAVQQILAAPTPPIEQPPAGPVPPPRDETALVPTPDDLPFNVVDSSGADWLTGGNPIVTQTDVTPAVEAGPRHASRRTGALRVLGLTKHTPDEQDGARTDG